MSTTRTLQQLFQRKVSAPLTALIERDKGPKDSDRFEVWHHHASLRRPGEYALMLQLDQRR